MKIDFIFYLLKSMAGGVVVYYMANEFAVHKFWVVPLNVFILSVPLSLAGMYSITVRQTHRLSLFVQQGWVFRIFSGRTLRTILWILWSVISSFYMLIQFQFYQLTDWIIFFLVIPVFFLTYTLFRQIFAQELKPYLVTHMALTWAGWCVPAVMLIIYIIFLLNYQRLPVYPSLDISIMAQQSTVAHLSNSALVRHALQYVADFTAMKTYALGQISLINMNGALLGIALGSFVTFYNACKMLFCLLIPKQEFLRIVMPITEEAQPDECTKPRIAILAAIFTFVTVFIYIPLFVTLEVEVSQQSVGLSKIRKAAEKMFVLIDGHFYQQQVLIDLEKAKLEALNTANISLQNLEQQVDQAFDRLEVNVDHYLDWYYSLGGEYGRIGHLMVGNFEHYMTQKLHLSLQQGDAFKGFQVALDKALNAHKQALEEYHLAATKILANNRVDYLVSKDQITQQLILSDIFKAPQHDDIIKMQHRLSASGVAATAGVVGGLVITKIIGKVVGKTTFKFAVKGVSKIALSKAAGTTGGAAAGAATGALAGSIIPGVGTAIGAVVGGIIGGIATGLVIDKGLIELESYLNREQFKQAIIEAIAESRAEFKAALRTI